ncbi:MAG: hypothetical protein ACK6CT_10910 [Planctomycetia bacterium]
MTPASTKGMNSAMPTATITTTSMTKATNRWAGPASRNSKAMFSGLTSRSVVSSGVNAEEGMR